MERSDPLKSFERSPQSLTDTPVGEVSLTKQSFTEDCDINKIIARHRRTGVLEHINPRTPMYGDFSRATDLHTALELVSTAREEFMELPSEIRAMVGNDPERLLQALSDPEQTAALAEAGLPMEEGWESPESEKAEPPALEEKGAEDSAAITGGE